MKLRSRVSRVVGLLILSCVGTTLLAETAGLVFQAKTDRPSAVYHIDEPMTLWSVGFIGTTCPETTVYAAYDVLSGERPMFHGIPSGHSIPAEAGGRFKASILAHTALYSHLSKPC